MFSGRVVLQAQNRGAQQHDAVLAQFARHAQRVGAVELGVVRARRFEADPDRGDAQLHQFLVTVLAYRVGGGEDVERPALPGLLHPGEQIHGALLLQQEVLVHDEERLHLARGLRLLHHPEQFVAGLVEVEHLALAAEERRGGAEVAAHRAAHGRDDGGGTVDSCPGILTPITRRSKPEESAG